MTYLEEPKRRAGRPTQDDTRRKTETLLAVATDMFVSRGFNGATIEAIALAADMGKQAVYMRYPDKETLFTAVIQRLKDDGVPYDLPPDDDLPLAEGLRRRVRGILAVNGTGRAMLICKLVMREGHRFPDLLSLLTETTLERFTRPLAVYFERQQRKGTVRAIDSERVASMCVDLIYSENIRSAFQDALPTPVRLDECAARITDLVCRGLAAA